MDIVGKPLQNFSRRIKRNSNLKNKIMASNDLQNQRYQIAKDIMTSSL